MAQTATMPVTTPTPVGRSADPCVMVIFGASGDLTQRKLIPALYNLARVQLLSPNFAVVGVARRPMSSEEYRRKLSEEVREFVTGLRCGALGCVCPSYALPGGEFRQQRHLREPQAVVGQDRSGELDSRQLFLLPGDGAGRLWRDRRKPRGRRADAAGQWALAPGHYRKALRPRPGKRP